jgi:hypothetical protein
VSYVYVMFRPDGRPCYIGKGTGDRANNFKRRHNLHLSAIIKNAGGSLLVEKSPDTLMDSEAMELERLAIALIGRETNGGSLVNLTDGGDGIVGITQEIREKISAKNKARYLDPIEREKASARMRGIKVSSETRARQSISQRGRKHSLETRAKMKVSQLASEARAQVDLAKYGKTASLETRQKMRKAHLGRKMSPEAIEKAAASHRGKKRPSEALARMSAGQRARWAKPGAIGD